MQSRCLKTLKPYRKMVQNTHDEGNCIFLRSSVGINFGQSQSVQMQLTSKLEMSVVKLNSIFSLVL